MHVVAQATLIFLSLYSQIKVESRSNPFNISCAVYNRNRTTCTFDPGNYGRLTLCYSSCYGCFDNTLYVCPQLVHNSCTWVSTKKHVEDTIHTLFVCDKNETRVSKELAASKMVFLQRNIIKPNPVGGLIYKYLGNTSVNISWSKAAKSFQYEIILLENCSNGNEIHIQETNHRAYYSLKPNCYFCVAVRCQLLSGGYWSDPVIISFPEDEGFSRGGLVELLGFEIIKVNGNSKDVELHWKIVNKYSEVESFSLEVVTAAPRNSITEFISNVSRSFRVTLNSTDQNSFRVVLAARTKNGKHSKSEQQISVDDELSKMPGDFLLLIDSSKVTLVASLGINTTATLYCKSNAKDELTPSSSFDEIGHHWKWTTCFNVTLPESCSVYISMKRMVNTPSGTGAIVGPMIPITTYYRLDTELNPPLMLELPKKQSESLTVRWEGRLESNSRYFSDVIIEYYPTECETCSVQRMVPRHYSNWTFTDLPEGQYLLKLKSFCNFTKKTSNYTPYKHVTVIRRSEILKLVLPILLSSILLIAGFIIGSRVCLNMKSRIVIQMPPPISTGMSHSNEKYLYHVTPLHKAKSFYKILFNENAFANSQCDSSNEPDSFAWWNPGYRFYQKYSAESSLSLTSIKHPFYENEYENFYSKEKMTESGLDHYSSVKIISFQQK